MTGVSATIPLVRTKLPTTMMLMSPRTELAFTITSHSSLGWHFSRRLRFVPQSLVARGRLVAMDSLSWDALLVRS